MIVGNYLNNYVKYIYEAPTLAPNQTWYKGSITRNKITEIHIVDTYIITGEEDEIWNADDKDEGRIKCYLTGTVLYIVGDGHNRILANPDSSFVFGGNSSTTRYSKVVKFTGLEMLDTRKATTMERMFDGLFLLEYLNTSRFNTSNVTNMNAMFNNCELIDNLDVSSFRTDKVTDMYAMFADCTKLRFLDTSKWRTHSLINANSLFYDCYALESVDLSNMDFVNTTNMGLMMYYCTSLKHVTLKRSVPTHNTNTVAEAVLADCYALETVDISNFYTTNVKNISYFFEDCHMLEKIDLSSFDLSTITDIRFLFTNAKILKMVDLNNWDITNFTDNQITWMFNGCPSGVTFYVSDETTKTRFENLVNVTGIEFVIGKMP